jgi:hypothetical protein
MELQEQPESIEDIREKFEHWRSSKKNSREHIPATLWKSAAVLTKVHSINAVAKVMRLNGQNLKKQVAKYCGKNQAETPAPSDFIELTCKPPIAAAECTIELSDQKGIKMRMTFKGNHKLDIPGLISSFRAESR